MANVQPTLDLRGLMVPDERLAGTYTATSQAGPMPGTPIPAVATSMVLDTSGEVDTFTTSTGISVYTERAGYPGRLGATYRWCPTGESYRLSSDPPTSISDFKFIERTTTVADWGRPHAIRRSGSGLPIVVAANLTTDVSVWKQSILGVWSEVVVHAGEVQTAACIVELPTGRLVVLQTVRSFDTTLSQIRMSYSDDDGATWATGCTDALVTPIIYATSKIQRIRCAVIGNQTVLMVWVSNTANDYLFQYAGDAGATTFELVETTSSTAKAAPDLVAIPGGVMLATIEYDATLTATVIPRVRVITNAYQGFSTVSPVLGCASTDTIEWGLYGAGIIATDTECALLCDDDGMFYLYGRNDGAGSTKAIIVTVSTDGGATWNSYYKGENAGSTMAVHANNDASTYMSALAVCPGRGSSKLFHTFVASPGDADASLCVVTLGGPTTIPMPDDSGYALGRNVAGWGHVWLPFDKPQDVGGIWTRAVTGAPTETLGSSGLETVCAGGENIQYYSAPVMADATGGLMCLFHLKVVSGTVYLDLRASNGTNDYNVRVTVTTTAIVLRDLNAGADIATLATTVGADGVQILMAVGNAAGNYAGNVGKVYAWHNSHWEGLVSGMGPFRQWTEIGNSAALTSGAATTTQMSYSTATGVSDVYLRTMCVTGGTYTAGNLFAGGGTRGRGFPTPAQPGHVYQGLRLLSMDGPTVKGDSWTIPIDYQYAASNADPWTSPRPGKTYRSTGDSSTHDITITCDTGYTAGDLIGIYVQGVNFQTFSLYQDVGLNLVATCSLAIGTGLSFTRTRDEVTPLAGGGGIAGPFLENMLTGCRWIDSVGGTPYKIVGNRSGHWRSGGVKSYVPTRINLDTYGGLGTGGAGQIYSDRGLFITQLLTSTNTLTFRIPAQVTLEDYFEVGVLAIGRVIVHGQQYGRRSVEGMSGVERIEGRYGSTRSRRLLPERRAVEYGWADGVDTARLYGGLSAPPDYVTLGYTSAPPIAIHRADVPTQTEAIIRRHGKRCPVVYAPQIVQPASAPTTTTPVSIVDPSRLMWSWIDTDTLRTETIVGQEFTATTGEVVRVGTVKLLEAI